MAQVTVSKRTANRLAADERMRLCQGLEAFANLGDSLQDLERFRLAWPTFYPVDVCGYGGEHVGLLPQYHKAVLLLRDCLRTVWVWREPPRDAAGFPLDSLPDHLFQLLLGLTDNLDAWIVARFHGDPLVEEKRRLDAGLPPDHSGASTGVNVLGRPKLVSLFPDAFLPSLNKLRADWHRGTFDYEPQTDFQRALWELFRESWRAKVCSQCGKYFVADKAAQSYCSTACTGTAKQRRALDWWREHGNEWRKKRQRAAKKQRAGRPGKRGK